jgi:D-alanyl-lipoteichoic acid acyltransferase DltB (MBOAT superfamily)
VFGIGLSKKLLLADPMAAFADPVFEAAAEGGAVAPTLAWIGTLAYTLQLYFDFSGYSDMALGIAWLFGFRLPLNFDSPLKACSITDFWRRWHITMTRFFTNYLYAALAVPMTRRALRGAYRHPARFLAATVVPVTLTFVLAGLWHGAGWTFVVFGLIHGLALALNHAWREAGMRPLPSVLGWLSTMAVVVLGLVFFRAADVTSALALLAAMAGMAPATAAGAAQSALAQLDPGAALVWIAALGAIALGCPNTQELMSGHWFSSDPQPPARRAWPAWLAWRPTPAWAAIGALALAAALGSISSDAAFLYYQF